MLWAYLLIVDVTVRKVTPVILHGVVSPDKQHRAPARPRRFFRAVLLNEGLSRMRDSTSMYRGYSKVRTHTALGPYASSMLRSIGPS